MGYQNEVCKIARLSRTVLIVRNIAGNLGRKYVVLMGTCQEMRILRPIKLSFCCKKNFFNIKMAASSQSFHIQKKKWIREYKKSPSN